MKKGILPLIFLLSLPIVFAEGLITEGFRFLFGQATNEIVLKLGLFIILTAIFKAGLVKIKLFEEHPNSNVIVALFLALIAVKFMPVAISTTIGSLIWVVALFALPYLLLSLFIKEKTWLKIFLSGLLVAVIYYFVTDGGFGFYGSRYPYLGFIRGHEIIDDIFYHISFNKWLVPALLAIIIIALLVYKGRLWSRQPGEEGAWSKWRQRAAQRHGARQDRKARVKEAKETRKAEKRKATAEEKKAIETRKAEQARAAQDRKARVKEAREKKKMEGGWFTRWRQRAAERKVSADERKAKEKEAKEARKAEETKAREARKAEEVKAKGEKEKEKEKKESAYKRMLKWRQRRKQKKKAKREKKKKEKEKKSKEEKEKAEADEAAKKAAADKLRQKQQVTKGETKEAEAEKEEEAKEAAEKAEADKLRQRQQAAKEKEEAEKAKADELAKEYASNLAKLKAIAGKGKEQPKKGTEVYEEWAPLMKRQTAIRREYKKLTGKSL